MAQHDYVLSNQTRTNLRQDLNAALAAILSNNSGASAPTTTAPYMWWPDTTAGKLKIRNATDTAWIIVGDLASVFFGLADLATANDFTASQKLKGDALIWRFKDTGASGVEWGIRSDGGNLELCENTGTEGTPIWMVRKKLNLYPVDDTGAADNDPVIFNVTNKTLKKGTAASGLRDLARNLVIKNSTTNTDYQLVITADEVVLRDSNNNARTYFSVSKTLDVTVSGVNGLDAGAEAASTWYHIWVIGKSDGTLDTLLSTSATSPTMPSGYTYKAYLDSMYNDATSNFIRIHRKGEHTSRTPMEVLVNGTAAANTAINLTTVIPVTAKKTKFKCILDNGTSGNITRITCVSQTDGNVGQAVYGAYISSGATNSSESTFEILAITPQTIYYAIDGTATPKVVSLSILGWEV